MLVDTRTEIVFTTGEIEDAKFVGGSKEQAQAVFTAWLESNKDFINAGNDTRAVEIIGVNFDLIKFNGQVFVDWLCAECDNGGCEINGDYHEDTISNCEIEEANFVSEYRY